MNRVVLVSKELAFQEKCKSAIDTKTKTIILSDKKAIKNFEFLSDDVVVFDIDEFEDVLSLIIKKSKVLCLSFNLDELKAYKLLKKGLQGYDSIDMELSKLKDAIRTIKDGKIWISSELMSFIIVNSTISSYSNQTFKINKLTNKELEVAKLVSKGLTNQQISEELGITLRTVKAHVSSSFAKLELKDRVCLAMFIKEALA